MIRILRVIRNKIPIPGFFAGIIIVGCATVPKEVVELSYVVGDDIAELQVSYDATIHELYDQLRAQRLVYLEDTWTPRFIEAWIENGKLIQVAKGELVWSESEEAFVPPTMGREQHQLLETINAWTDEAVYRIEEKRTELIDPLDIEEDSLRLIVNEAFSRLLYANATVTAYLNSIREVKELQDELLGAMSLKDLRDKINSSLISASNRAAESLRKIEEADRKLDEP